MQRLFGLAAVLFFVAPSAGAARQQAPAPAALVFNRVTVIDVEHGKSIPAQRVVIVGNRITAVGAAKRVKVPSGAQVVDARGKYLIPGLWDMHVHTGAASYPMFVANGVTGIRSAGWGLLDTLVEWRREILAGSRVGPPRQLLAGDAVSVDSGQEVPPDSLKARHANFLKVYPFTFAKAAAARRAGLPFGGHVTDVSAAEASDSGAGIIDHIAVGTSGGLDTLCWNAPGQGTVERCRPVAERLRRNGTWFVPTAVMVMYAVQIDSPPFPIPVSAHAAPYFARLLGETRRFWADSAAFRGNWLRDAEPARLVTAPADTFGRLSVIQRVGLPVLAGTDVIPIQKDIVSGFSLQAELAMLVAEGLTPLSALQSATLNPAKLIRGTDSLGAIAAGKLADVVLLDADPLADITNTTTIRAVVANGRYFDRAALDRLLADFRAKKVTWRQSPRPASGRAG